MTRTIISTSPLRVSLVGGGTDIPDVSEHLGGGSSVGFAINFSMILLGHRFLDGLRFKYSETEDVGSVHQLRHNILREVCSRLSPNLSNYEIGSFCDATGGTGLGSSSAFTIALINLLRAYNGFPALDSLSLAHLAAEAEISWCNRNIGLQDQLYCATPGVTVGYFRGMKIENTVKLPFNEEWCSQFGSPFCLFRLNGVHDSSVRLRSYSSKLADYSRIKSLVPDAIGAVETNNVEDLAAVVREVWVIKKATDDSDFVSRADCFLDFARSIDPSAGGKVVGSGGGGYMLLISRNKRKLMNRIKGLIDISVNMSAPQVTDFGSLFNGK